MQHDPKYAQGFFIYLKQNSKNLKNPYDLVPYNPEELEDSEESNRATDNLNCIENYDKKR